jgi:hypothetical protein
MGFGGVRHCGGDALTFSLLNQIRGLVWIEVKRCQLVARRKGEAVEGSLNTSLEYLMTLSLFVKYFYIFWIKRSKCAKDIESFAKGNNKL